MYKIINGDVREKIKELKKESVDCIVTSPPYWRLRDYGNEKQLGLEETPEEYIKELCDIFDECNRVLKKQGTLFVVLNDSYSGSNSNSTTGRKDFKKQEKDLVVKKNKCVAKIKSLVGIPSMFLLEMINRGWRLRNKIIWHKPNAIPESVKDRFTNDYEEIFFFVKRRYYYFDLQFEEYKTDWIETFKKNNYNETSNKKNGRQMRTVWSVNTQGLKHNHFASFPEEIVERCIRAGCPKNGVVLDIFLGTGTTLLVAEKLERNGIGIELNEEYIEIAKERLNNINKVKTKRKVKKKENIQSLKTIQHKLFE